MAEQGPWSDYAAPQPTQAAGPWSDYGKPQAPTEDQANAALQGAGNAWTLGQLPKGQAFVQSLLPDPDAEVNAKLKAQGIQIQEPAFNDYQTALKGYQADRERTASEMPEAYYGGEAAGALTLGGPVAGRGVMATGRGLLSLAKNEALRKAAEAGGIGYAVYKEATK